MNWSKIIEGVTTGVTAATVLALFVLMRHRVRDLIFRWRLRHDLKNFGFGWNRHGLTIGIRNWVGKSFTVRELVVITDKDNYQASPMKDVSSSSPEEIPPLTWRQRRALKKGDSSVLPSTVTHGVTNLHSWLSAVPEEGFVTVDPFTQRSFVFANTLFDQQRGDGIPRTLRITVEYEAWPGRRKMMQWEVKTRASDLAARFAEMRQRVRMLTPPTQETPQS